VVCSVSAQGIDGAKEAIATIRHTGPSLTRDSILIHNYNFLAEAYSGKDDSLAKHYIDTLAQLRQTSAWNKTEGLYHRALGKYHDRRGEFEKALNEYSLAIESFEKVGDESDYIVYANILKAFVLNNNGLHETALDQLTAVRPLAEKLENKNSLAWIIDAFGDYYFYSSFGHMDYRKALEYYLQVEAILPQVRNQSIVADNAHCLAGCQSRLGEAKALAYRDKAADCRENGYQNIIFAVYGDLARLRRAGKFEEAIKYRQLSLVYARQSQWIEMEARAERISPIRTRPPVILKKHLRISEHLSPGNSLSRYDVQER
jgi:tetratricopeptide (TPR) repeat protein